MNALRLVFKNCSTGRRVYDIKTGVTPAKNLRTVSRMNTKPNFGRCAPMMNTRLVESYSFSSWPGVSRRRLFYKVRVELSGTLTIEELDPSTVSTYR